MANRVLVINPGSTSTKIGVFEEEKELFTESLSHSAEEISKYSFVADQFEFRMNTINDVLKSRGFDVKTLSCIVGRGGLLHAIPGGTYLVNENMKKDLKSAEYGEHASNLGGLIADAMAKPLGIPAYIADPVVVDELSDVARIYGHKDFKKQCIFHALNQKAVARRWAKENNKMYEEVNLIVAHMGGGVSIGLHSNGRVVDVNNALNGEGPFSPERAGTLPALALAKLCFSGKVTYEEVSKMINGRGGVVSLAGTNDMRELEAKIASGDKKAALVYEAFSYNVGKAIAALAAVVDGKVDQIILTGGIAYGKAVQNKIKQMTSWIAPVTVYPGEGELPALAAAGLRGLSGDVQVY